MAGDEKLQGDGAEPLDRDVLQMLRGAQVPDAPDVGALRQRVLDGASRTRPGAEGRVRSHFGWGTVAASAAFLLLAALPFLFLMRRSPYEGSPDNPEANAVIKNLLLVPFIIGSLNAQDANWLEKPVEAKDLPAEYRTRFDELVNDLSNDDFQKRNAAVEEIKRNIDWAAPLLAERYAKTRDVSRTMLLVDQDLVAQLERLNRFAQTVPKLFKLYKFISNQPLKEGGTLRSNIQDILSGKVTPQDAVLKSGPTGAQIVVEEAGKLNAEVQLRARVLLRELLKDVQIGRTVTLSQRSQNEYGDSAYSFRFASSDLDVHKNVVELMYGNCGLLHTNVCGGQENRIADVGEKTLDEVNAIPDAAWKDCVHPMVGHVYVEQIRWDGKDLFTVKFAVTERENGKLTLTWVYLGEEREPENRDTKKTGPAGTMGECGGDHDEFPAPEPRARP